MKIAMGLATGLVLLGLVACGGDKSDGSGGGTATVKKDDGGAAPAAGKTKYDPAAHKGSLTGTVKFDGARPDPVKLIMGSDDTCLAAWADKDAYDEKFWVNEDGTLPNVFIYPKKTGPQAGYTGYTAPTGFQVVQEGCFYKPHVFGVMAKQSFDVLNSDNTMHNVNVKPGRNDGFNKGQDPGQSDTVSFSKKEAAIPFKCDVHSWMSAWCFVLDHPFFATTDAKGQYSIAGLPDGDYEFTFWHENFGETTKNVTIAGGAATLDASLTK